MSRAHAVAPVAGAEAPYRGPLLGTRPLAPSPRRRQARPASSFYVERALLLWPRLDKAKLCRCADNPTRMAEIIVRRTSQPLEVILAMLTRQAPALASPTEDSTGFDTVRAETTHVSLRIVRSEESGPIQVQDLLHA